MHPTQLRLDEDLERQVRRLARRGGTTTSEALRTALKEGLRTILLREAVTGYQARRFSLGSAAEHAGISLAEMAGHLATLEIPFYRYPASEVSKDAARARSWLR